jgi:hypothetical protein
MFLMTLSTGPFNSKTCKQLLKILMPFSEHMNMNMVQASPTTVRFTLCCFAVVPLPNVIFI